MELQVTKTIACGTVVTIVAAHVENVETYECYIDIEAIEHSVVGACLCLNGKGLFKVLRKQEYIAVTGVQDGDYEKVAVDDTILMHGVASLRCIAMHAIQAGKYGITVEAQRYTLACVTLSDKGSRGKRHDCSGPLIGTILRQHLPIALETRHILADDSCALEALLIDLSLRQEYNLIITTGGTGVSPRDNTADVMERILHSELLGFEIAMLQASMQHVSTAILSRAKAGIIYRSIVINVPGSPTAVEQNLKPLLPALQHAMDKVLGDTAECSGMFLHDVQKGVVR